MEAGSVSAYNSGTGTIWTLKGWSKNGTPIEVEIEACDNIFRQLGQGMKKLLDSRQAELDNLRRHAKGE